MLTAAEPFGSPAASEAVTDHLCDLLALSLGATADARDQAQERGLQAARLNAVKKHLERHLADAQLSPDAVATQFRMSSRTLQRLFEREQTTFSEFLLARRLDHAYGLLGDPRERRRSIAEIALDCGFGDVSYFNRTFRERYDATPSDVRHHRVFAQAAE
jgi:AraC-like DNA-binding protein